MSAYKQDERSRDFGGAGWRPDGAPRSRVPEPVRTKASLFSSINTGLHSSRKVRLIAALALIALCGVAVPVLVNALTPKPAQALAVASDLPAGTVITQADLRTVNASGPTGATVPAADQASMIGQTVRVEVPAGSLLTEADLGPFPPIGATVVPVSVKPGQYPANLQTGDQVAVFPVSTSSTSQAGTAAHAAATGTVTQISPVASDGAGQVVVDLEVATASAAVIAQAPAVVLVGLDSRGDAP
jgi:hypothetical protein